MPHLSFVSGSGNGRHVFVLFSRMVPKSYARLFGKHYAELIGVGEKDGVLEVFPKRDEIDKIENIALPLARQSVAINDFKIVPFDPVTWKPTLSAYQLDVRSKIAEAFVEDADKKVAAYGVKIPTLAWNSSLGKDTIAKAGFAYLSADGEHIYALCFPKDRKRANDSRLKAKDVFGDDYTEVLKAAPPMPYEGLAFQVVVQGDTMAYVARREVTAQAPGKPGRKGKAQDNDEAFDCAAKMYEVDEYSLPKDKKGTRVKSGWLEFMMACHSAFRHDANQLSWVRGRFLDWSKQSAKYDKVNDPIKFDEEGPLSETSPRVFWVKAGQGGYKGAAPYKKDDLEAESIIDLVLDGKQVFLGPQRKPYIEMGKRHYVLLELKGIQAVRARQGLHGPRQDPEQRCNRYDLSNY